MSACDLTQLAREVDARCRLQGSFTLRSGQVSNEYFDKYLFESDPALLRRVTEAMAELIPADTDFLGGLELGGVPLATVLSQMTGIPALFVRKQAKNYGTKRLAEGGDPTACTVTLVEDVITTGGAVISAARALRELGATVTTAVCAIDRSPSGANSLADKGIAVKSVLTKALLDAAAKTRNHPHLPPCGRSITISRWLLKPAVLRGSSRPAAGISGRSGGRAARFYMQEAGQAI